MQRLRPARQPLFTLGADIGIRDPIGGIAHRGIERHDLEMRRIENGGELVDTGRVEPAGVEKKHEGGLAAEQLLPRLLIPGHNIGGEIEIRRTDARRLPGITMGERIVRTRKLVLAAGIETRGRWWMPPEIAALPARLRAHTADAIDFEALRGRKVIVIGAAASAFDNAATALEHGASVQMLCRRDSIQRVQPYKVLAFSGFLGHMGRMPDRDRWRIMNYLLTVREALTAETWARATRHADFDLVTDAPILSAKESNGRAYIETKGGNFEADFVIAGTGFDVDLHSRPELDGVADLIATWSDRYAPPPSEANPRLGRYPYLDDGMAFTEKTLGEAPWIRNIYCFNFGATASFGPSGSSISALKYAAPRLVAALTESLFREDLRIHEDMIRGYSTPEFDLKFARDVQDA